MDKGHTVAKFDQILLPKIPFYISQLILSNGPKYLGNLKKSSNRVSVFRAIIYRPFGMLHLENCFQTFWHRSKAFSKLMYNFCAMKGKKTGAHFIPSFLGNCNSNKDPKTKEIFCIYCRLWNKHKPYGRILILHFFHIQRPYNY